MNTISRLGFASVFIVASFLGACAGSSAPAGGPNSESASSSMPNAMQEEQTLHETAHWGELAIRANIMSISSSPDGDIWLTGYAGHFRADSIDGDWDVGTLPMRDSGLGIRGGISVGAIDHFDDSVWLAWGGAEIVDRVRGVTQAMRTTDGGATWQEVDIGYGRSVQAMSLTPEGHGWASVTSAAPAAERGPIEIYWTTDFGRQWSLLHEPPPTSSAHVGLHAESATSGFVAERSEGIYRTTDGGWSWEELPTPLSQGAYEGGENRIGADVLQDFLLFGDWLVVRQDGRVFASPRDAVVWTPILGLEPAVVTPSPSGNRLFMVTEDRRVHELGQDLVPAWSSDELIRAPLMAYGASEDGFLAIDADRLLYHVGPERFMESFAWTSGEYRAAIREVARDEGDLWGFSERALYTSPDEGTTWLRVPHGRSTVEGLKARGRNEALIWDGRGANMLVDRSEGTAIPVADLDSLDVVGVVEHDGVWYAHGGLQRESAGRIDVARSFTGTEFRGSRDFGFVYRSDDEGLSWTRVDHWEEGGVMGLFVHDGGELTLQSYTGSIRRVRPTPAGYEAETLILADADNRDEVPYVEMESTLYFSDLDTGFIAGSIHHRGRFSFRTDDGGQSWQEVDEDHVPFRTPVVRWGDGHLSLDQVRILRLMDGSVEELADLSRFQENEFSLGLRGLTVTPDGRILVMAWTDGRSDAILRFDPASGLTEVLN